MLPILVSLTMLVACVAVHAIACGITLRFEVAVTRPTVEAHFWRPVLAMQSSTLILMISHMTQVIMWSIPLFVVGDLRAFAEGFYFSMQNYTTLGYGDVLLKDEWRILGPIEAATGVLMFGLSTAIMVRLLTDFARLRDTARHRS